MITLEELAPKVEIYSTTKLFDLTGVNHCCSLSEFGHQVRETIYDWIGILARGHRAYEDISQVS